MIKDLNNTIDDNNKSINRVFWGKIVISFAVIRYYSATQVLEWRVESPNNMEVLLHSLTKYVLMHKLFQNH